MAIGLGDKVRHKITGFKGVAIAITKWLNGCVRITVQGESLTKEGAIKPTETIDEDELVVTKKGYLPSPTFAPGGPKPSPKQLESARRR